MTEIVKNGSLASSTSDWCTSDSCLYYLQVFHVQPSHLHINIVCIIDFLLFQLFVCPISYLPASEKMWHQRTKTKSFLWKFADDKETGMLMSSHIHM